MRTTNGLTAGSSHKKIQGMKTRVLFLCTGNSCRSQMAEGLLRNLRGDRFEVFSAGTDPKPVHPWAVAAMREIDIDISHQSSKSIDALPAGVFDVVVTVCDSAKQRCPVIPRVKQKMHWSIPDPAAAAGTQREIETAFRNVRDALKDRIEKNFPGS